MKIICIHIDASLYPESVAAIRRLTESSIVPLLKYIFQVKGVITDGTAIKVYIDVQGVDDKMDYLSISNFCQRTCQEILFHKGGWDCGVSPYTEQLPAELLPPGITPDIVALAELKKNLDREETISIPRSMAEEIVDFCDGIDHCEGVDRYPGFYYAIQELIGTK